MQTPTLPESKKIPLSYLFGFGFLMIMIGILIDGPAEVFRGWRLISTAPGNLLSDGMAIGGVGAAFFNSGLLTLGWTAVVRWMKLEVTGGIFAGIITVAGFSFFGKDLYNSVPIALGGLLYARSLNVHPRSVILSMLFGTTLAPTVSFITFGLGLPLVWGIPLGWLAGILIGFLIPLTSGHFLAFHQGFNIYNTGFTAGIIGMSFAGLLRLFSVEIPTRRELFNGDDSLIRIGFGIFFVALIIFGYFRNGKSFAGYRKLLKESGRLATDYPLLFNNGLTYINMGFCGLIALGYVIVSNAVINGPIIGGILTVLAFSAFGKHPRNIAPVLVGTIAANFFGVHDLSSTGAVLSGLFGTCLAPISGYYGWIFGVFAGALHTAMVNNVGFLHGGLNLYNNGFSGGFVAGLLVPVFDHITRRNQNENA